MPVPVTARETVQYTRKMRSHISTRARIGPEMYRQTKDDVLAIGKVNVEKWKKVKLPRRKYGDAVSQEETGYGRRWRCVDVHKYILKDFIHLCDL